MDKIWNPIFKTKFGPNLFDQIDFKIPQPQASGCLELD